MGEKNKNLVYLAQTDTTAGLLSKDYKRLNRIKGRPEHQPVLKEVASLETLQSFVRVPKKFRREIRNSKRITYIYLPTKNAIRVVNEGLHHLFLKKFQWLYSTSANPSGKPFNLEWSKIKADVIVEDKRGFFESFPSFIIIIGKKNRRKVRW